MQKSTIPHERATLRERAKEWKRAKPSERTGSNE